MIGDQNGSSTISLGGNINELAKITLDTVTNTSGAYSHTTTVSGITPDHKVLSIECGDWSVFRAPITISTATNAITLSCDSVVGTSTVIVYVLMTGDNVPITSLEYSALSTRVGNLSDLETSDKSSIVNSINSLNDNLMNADLLVTTHTSVTTAQHTVPSMAKYRMFQLVYTTDDNAIWAQSSIIPASIFKSGIQMRCYYGLENTTTFCSYIDDTHVNMYNTSGRYARLYGLY